MSTIELYNALVKAGVEDSKAKSVSESLVTFEDAKDFATQTEFVSLRSDIEKLEQKMDIKFNILTALGIAIFMLLVGQYFIK